MIVLGYNLFVKKEKKTDQLTETKDLDVVYQV